MKFKHEVESAGWLSRYDRPKRRRQLCAAGVVFDFQPRREGDFNFDGGGPARRPGFSRLAREVLLADASRSFRLETAVLGLISLVSAWPIAVMIGEVIRLMK